MIKTPAKTPQPPYYSVTTTATFNETHDANLHATMGLELYGEAINIDGFLGWEVGIEADFGIAISYWKSLEAIEIWRHHQKHKSAKLLGKKWFAQCMTRIACVERDYGFKPVQD